MSCTGQGNVNAGTLNVDPDVTGTVLHETVSEAGGNT
jgi:hypothetical protein